MANLVFDGTNDFSGGQNAAVDEGVIAPNMYSYARNVSTQRATLSPSWGYEKQELDFSSTGNYTRINKQEVSYKFIYETCRFQAHIPYSIGADYYIIQVIGGFLFLVNQSSLKVTVLNPNDPVSIYAPRINWSAAGQYLVVFDFPNDPLIVQGITSRRADPSKNEVPVSVLGAYNQNRLFIGNAGNEFTGGDPAGSLATPDAPITFNEVIQNSSPYVGQIFQLSTNYNNDMITAMAFLQVVDTSTGIGPLLVSTNKAIYSYRTDQPRALWEAGQFGSVFLYSNGIVGQRAHVNVNSDLMFLSNDGQIRSLSMSRDEQRRWSTVPISREVSNFLKYIDPALKPYSFMGYHNNKVFASANPYRLKCLTPEGLLQSDVAFEGVVTLELDNLAGIGSESRPVWAGMWDSIRPLDMCVNNDGLYISAKEGNINVLYRATPNRSYIKVSKNEKKFLKATVYTRGYISGDGTVNKLIHSLNLGIKEIRGEFLVKVYYRPEHYTNFIHWNNFKHNAPVSQCLTPISYPNGLGSHSIRDLNIGGVNENLCDEVNQLPLDTYKQVQLKLEITGEYWELVYIKLKSKLLMDDELEIYCDDGRKVLLPLKCEAKNDTNECS